MAMFFKIYSPSRTSWTFEHISRAIISFESISTLSSLRGSGHPPSHASIAHCVWLMAPSGTQYRYFWRLFEKITVIYRLALADTTSHKSRAALSPHPVFRFMLPVEQWEKCSCMQYSLLPHRIPLSGSAVLFCTLAPSQRWLLIPAPRLKEIYVAVCFSSRPVIASQFVKDRPLSCR